MSLCDYTSRFIFVFELYALLLGLLVITETVIAYLLPTLSRPVDSVSVALRLPLYFLIIYCLSPFEVIILLHIKG